MKCRDCAEEACPVCGLHVSSHPTKKPCKSIPRVRDNNTRNEDA